MKGNRRRKIMADKIKELYLSGKTYRQIADIVGMNPERVRWKIRQSDYYNPKSSEQQHFKSKKEFRQDGSMLIEEKVALKDIDNYEQVLTDLKLDPNQWEIVSARFSKWDSMSEEGTPLYATKISVKPKTVTFSVDDFINKVNEGIKPITLDRKNSRVGQENLVLPLFDLHFGNMKLEEYQESLQKMLSTIEKGYKNIVIICGGDILNEDNYNGTTASGTSIEKTDMMSAWQDCFQFINTLLVNAYNNCENVKLVYIPGNHDTFSGHTVLLALRQYHSLNTDIEFDISQEVYKAFMLENVFIGCTHGHKSRVSRYPMLMATRFPKLWGEANIRECFTGHLHTEWLSKDTDGIQIRQMPSRNKPDQWHTDMGFTASHKRFIMVTYTSDEISSLIYA